jgi:hypothetical protein
MQIEPIRLLASCQEAAKALAVSVRTIDALGEQGELEPVWIGSRKLFRWSQIQSLAGVAIQQDRVEAI